MKFEYSLISNLHRKGLMVPFVILFLICECKKYCVRGFNTGNISVGQDNSQIQVQKSSERELLGDFIRRFLGSRRRGIIK